MHTGFLVQGDTTYFLDRSGAMATGWINNWGTMYYFYPNGAMARNTIIDGIPLGPDGKIVQEASNLERFRELAAPYGLTVVED